MAKKYSPVVYKGKKYDSASILATELGLNKGDFAKKISEGIAIEDAVLVCQKIKNRKFDYNGTTYNSLDELSEAFDINECTLRNRIYKLGMTTKEAIETPIKSRRVV